MLEGKVVVTLVSARGLQGVRFNTRKVFIEVDNANANLRKQRVADKAKRNIGG